ncbi:leucine-rich repeat-containing protein 20 isoform X1 [Phalacrocorax aristotelis]|uniref:leucine-rich repeat-containing protein 20 isoform X1 n=1 Tax=Phalacrocorax aristotelis TaxID=126867 RepID=UPI003F4BB36C
MPLPRGWSGWFLPAAVDPPGQSVSPAGPGARMQKRMGEAVARVARKVNDTVENKTDSLDLANCKLMTFPVGIYKAMRSVTEGIHHISLANNELKSLTSRFVTTFNQLRGFGVFLSPWLPSLPWRPSTWKRMRSQKMLRQQGGCWRPLARLGRLLLGTAVADFLLLSIREPLLIWDNGMENASLLTATEEPASGFPSAGLEKAGRSRWPPKAAEVPAEKLATMASLRSLNLRANPVGPEVRLLVRPLVPFDLLLSPEEPIPKA